MSRPESAGLPTGAGSTARASARVRHLSSRTMVRYSATRSGFASRCAWCCCWAWRAWRSAWRAGRRCGRRGARPSRRAARLGQHPAGGARSRPVCHRCAPQRVVHAPMRRLTRPSSPDLHQRPRADGRLAPTGSAAPSPSHEYGGTLEARRSPPGTTAAMTKSQPTSAATISRHPDRSRRLVHAWPKGGPGQPMPPARHTEQAAPHPGDAISSCSWDGS